MGSEGKEAHALSYDKVICAICYEEAKPACEDLQSISLCGHVFHELCLQQWLEYCPRGRKRTCPLCKQQCSDKDVHRLYFQSASEATQATQENCSGLPYACDDVETLQATVQKLTGQLSITKASLESHQEQLQEANRQLSACTLRAERSESAQLEAQREKSSFKDALLRTQEELKRCSVERSKLFERNASLTKELASNNLTQNLDIDEDEVARMSRVGCRNKDDVIGTLTRSLIVRNRAYKDLMVKCNALGTGENKALRKYEKAFERIKRLKLRVQELERILEDKENGDLRALKGTSNTNPLVQTSKVMGTSLPASKPPLALRSSSQTNQIPATSTEPVNVSKAGYSINVNRNACVFLEDEEDVQFLVSEEVDMSENSSKQGRSNGISATDISRSNSSSRNRGGEFCEVGGISHGSVGDDPPVTGFIRETEPSLAVLSGSHFPVTIRKEVRLSTGTASETGTTGTIRDNQVPNPGKWCKQSSSWSAQREDSSGTFISFGANGRGGQVKVLRPPPPMLKVGGGMCGNWLRPPAKKSKPSSCAQLRGNQQGSLQIEHFFGGL